MNATQATIFGALGDSHIPGMTVAELVETIGRGETTVRKALKDLEASGHAVKNDKLWSKAPEHDVQRKVNADEADADETPKRKYRRHDKPTTRTVRTNQISKCEVAVVRTDEDKATADKHGIKTKWMTVCQTHDHAHGEDRVLDAHWYSSYPLFCREARKPVQTVVGRRRANKNAYPDSAERWMPKN